MQQPGAPDSPPTSTSVAQRPYPELSNRRILWSGVVLLMLSVSLVTVLLIAFGSGEHSSQLDAIKTAGTVVLGTGGAAALWLTARRQRSAEIALNQKHLDQAAVDRAFALQKQTVEENRRYQDRVAAATEHDAAQRRLSELYLKAVEQLGSDKAAVRHGGLYALERVAQDNPEQRQTVVNVLCAYLRAPYGAPGTSSNRRLGVRRPLLASSHGRVSAATSSPPARIVHRDANQMQQEREVRLTAQRILEIHLKPDPMPTFWPNIDLDLTSATLSELSLDDCRLKNARFDNAEFAGNSRFKRAEFAGDAGFVGAKFAEIVRFDDAEIAGTARFDGARFTGTARFVGAKFAEIARFDGAEFAGTARFVGAKFARAAGFERAQFTKPAWFERTEFAEGAWFVGTKFAEDAGFERAEFLGGARFEDAEFAGDAGFRGARFAGDARFGGSEFTGDARFGGSEFAGDAWFEDAQFAAATEFWDAEFRIEPRFEGAWVRTAGDDKLSRSWCAGWARANRPPVPLEGKTGLWVPLAVVRSPRSQADTNEQ